MWLDVVNKHKAHAPSIITIFLAWIALRSGIAVDKSYTISKLRISLVSLWSKSAMLVLLNFLTFAILCIAQVIPTAPGPGETFREGSDCTVKWKPDTTGTWDSFDIGEHWNPRPCSNSSICVPNSLNAPPLDLMSGSNDNMTYVIHVVSQLGGTSSSYSWTCPKVQPYSAIYFYQVCELCTASFPLSNTSVQFNQKHASTNASHAWTTRFTVSNNEPSQL